MIRTASFKGLDFRFGLRVLEIARERDIKEHKYPNLSGADIEDLGSQPHVFTVETIFPGTLDGRSDLKKLSNLFEEATAGDLFIPNLGDFDCFFRKFQDTGRSGENGFKEVELEFVETLQDDLTISRERDELEDMKEAEKQAKNMQAQLLDVPPEQIEKPETLPDKPTLPPLTTTKLPTVQTFYTEALKFATDTREKVAFWQQRIRDIQDTVTRPYNELTRFAAQIEQTANEATKLYRDVIQYADLPYTLARRLKNTANILTSISRRFLPPPVDSKGNLIGEQYHGHTLTHKVVSGDTLQTISVQHYGSAMLWECLAEANGISDGNDLTIGDTLILPDFGGVKPRRVETKPGKTRIGQSKCVV